MKSLGRKILALLLVITLVVPMSSFAQGDSEDFPGMLGEEWSVTWNGTKEEDGTSVAATEVVRIVDGESNTGSNSLAIGHETAATYLTLNYSLPVEAESYQSSVYVKTAGVIEWFTIEVFDGDTQKTSIPTEACNLSQWTKTTILAEGAENAGITSGTINIEFYIECDAGEYVYLDDFDIANASENDLQLNADNSFERWNAQINTEGEYTYDDFVNVVEGKSTDGTKALRIGNKGVATDIVLTFSIAKLEFLSEASYYCLSADYFVEGETLLEGSQMHWGVLGGPNDRKIDLASKLPTGDWYTASEQQGDKTQGENVYFPTTNKNGSVVAPYRVYVSANLDIQFELTVKCNAGTYLYIDNMNVYKEGTTVNIMSDSSFENMIQDVSRFAVTDTVTDISVVNSMIAPMNWDTSYNTKFYDRFVYLTSEAASGEYALAFKTSMDAVNYTLKQELPEAEADVTYHVELKARKTGDFTSVSLFETSGQATGNRNITYLIKEDSGIDKVGTRWTEITGTFTSRGESSFNMYIVAKPNAIITIDDIVIYKDGDESKTNLLENGDFEEYYFVNGERYRAAKSFSEAINKVEATVKFQADTPLTQDGGVLMGNAEYNSASINYGVTTYGRPYVSMLHPDGSMTNAIFDKVNVYTGEWLQLGFVHTEEAIDCYVNGVKADSVACNATSFIPPEPFVIGGDLQQDNPAGFKGVIKDIKVYGEADKLIGSWNLEQMSNADVAEDASESKVNLLHYGGYGTSVRQEGKNTELTELERSGYYIPTLQDDTEEYPYAFAAIGDTQYACKFDFVDHKVRPADTDDAETWQAELVAEEKRNFGKIYDWILSQKDSKNIKFVMGLGDITDYNTTFEWEYAQGVISKLNGQLPYSILKGDHDVKFAPDATRFDTYLAKSLISNSNSENFNDNELKYEEFGTYNGEYDAEGNLTSGSVAVAYHKLSVGANNHKWLVLSLSHDTPLAALDWVNDVIAENTEYNVIVTTHNYLVNRDIPDMEYYEEDDPDSFFSTMSNGAEYEARELWDKVISQHANIKFVLCGHRSSEYITVHRRTGVNGNGVTEMLINTQETDRMYGVQGLVSLLRFSADGSRVKVETYSTVHDQYFQERSQFVIDLDETIPAEVSNFEWYVKKTIDDITAYEVQDLIQVTETALYEADTSVERERIFVEAKQKVDVLANENRSNVTFSQIRANDDTLRFVLEIDDSLKQYLEDNYSGTVEFGTLLARSDLYKGVLEYTGLYDKFSANMATVVKRQSTYKPDNYNKVNAGETTVYTCVVRGIPDEFKDVEIRARSYVKFTDSSGNEHFIYGDEVATTYNKTLNSASE